VDQEEMKFFEGLFTSFRMKMNQRFDRFDERFHCLDGRFDRLEAQLERIEAQIDKIGAGHPLFDSPSGVV